MVNKRANTTILLIHISSIIIVTNNKKKLNMQKNNYTRYILKGYFHIFASFKLTNLTDKLPHA